MTAPIQIPISSNADRVLAQLERFPPAMMAAIAQAMNLENELTVGAIQAKKLSRRGPKTLGVVSNRLRSSISRTDAVVTEHTAESAIGTNVLYMKPHEFGFSGVVQVKAHKRRIIAHDRYIKRGRGFVKTQSGIPGTIRAHSMRMNIPERAPIRTTIQERAPRYGQAMGRAIVDTWGGAS